MKTRRRKTSTTADGKAALRRRRMIQAGAWTVASLLVVWSAIASKEAGRKPPVLAEVNVAPPIVIRPAGMTSALLIPPGAALGAPVPEKPDEVAPEPYPPEVARFAADPSVRWFNGRPVRPAREITMVVTAYSPDERSCGDSADGMTATLHSVETNGFALVAADPTVLRYGSMLTVPGYDEDRIVPVLDCGGAIKGRRLDVLYPTHERARQWGRRTLKVTVWEYADGLPAENPRKLR